MILHSTSTLPAQRVAEFSDQAGMNRRLRRQVRPGVLVRGLYYGVGWTRAEQMGRPTPSHSVRPVQFLSGIPKMGM
jgi:hypothetical protein